MKVEYEELPANFDPMHALDDDAPLIHDSGNVICKWKTQRGDVEEGFRNSDCVMERDYVTSRVQHVCIETEAAVAYRDPNTSEMIVRCPVNSPFVIRKTVAETLGLPRPGCGHSCHHRRVLRRQELRYRHGLQPGGHGQLPAGPALQGVAHP